MEIVKYCLIVVILHTQPTHFSWFNFNINYITYSIGSQAKALENINIEYELLNTCEWNVHSCVAYDLIHNGSTEIIEECVDLDKSEMLKLLNQYKLSLNGKAEATTN